MNKLFFAGVLTCSLVFLPQTAWAEEAPVEEVVVEETPAEIGYTPPPEAYEGVGGWAVVDPETNKVHGVIVCTVEGCGPQGNKQGKIGVEYMGCHADCVLRFQTRATSDGNVAGWGSGGGHDVRWDGDSEGTYTARQSGPDGSAISMKITPSQTARDAAGMDLHTGVSDIRTGNSFRDSTDRQGANVSTYLENQNSISPEISILYPEWGNRVFDYFSKDSFLSGIDNDVSSGLISEGYVVTEEGVDPDTGEVNKNEVLDEDNSFVKSIKEVTQAVIRFITSMFGGNDV
jgi:hypothetical protein